MIYKILIVLIFSCLYGPIVSAFEASYYNDWFEWEMSANGTIFSQSNHTAAICYEELSQFAYISTSSTGMVVTLTDRPNCSRHTDRIDLSTSVFSQFAPLSQWLISGISATPLGLKTWKFIKRNISQKQFSSLSVELKKEIPNTFFTQETISIDWRILDGWRQAIMLIVWKTSWTKIVKAVPVDKSGNFSFVVTLPDIAEEYLLALSSGSSVSTKDAVPILLVQEGTINYPDLRVGSLNFSPKIKGWSIPWIQLPDNLVGTLKITQQGKTQITKWNFLSFSWMSLSSWFAHVNLTGTILSTPSSLDKSVYIPNLYSWSVSIDRIRDVIGADKLQYRVSRYTFNFRFRLDISDKIRSSYYLTLPSGEVMQYDFPKKYDNWSGYLKTWIWISGNSPLPLNGTYKFELVRSDWLAYVNIPFYRWIVWPVVPAISDSAKYDISIERSSVINQTFNRINILRSELWRTTLIKDKTLDIVAQKKAEYMAKNDDFGHITKDGKDIVEFAKSIGIILTSNIWENIAWGTNVSGAFLQDWLEESWSHRHSMLNPKFSKIWVGFAVLWEKTYLVHVFSN